jgi:tetratricopeptide (TPR) repeat protein
VVAASGLALLAAVVALGFPYVSVREESVASDVRQTDPSRALRDLSTAADLNPLSPDPGRVAGTIALTTGQYGTALRRFEQAISRDPGGWYGWFGAGLAASAGGNRAMARHDFEVARAINHHEPVVRLALDQVDSAHPLPPNAALQELALAVNG